MCQVRVLRIKLKDWTVGSFSHCLQVWPAEQWKVLKLLSLSAVEYMLKGLYLISKSSKTF